MKQTILTTATLTALVVTLPSCARVALEGGDKPIHIVHDINIRVDRELEEFFAFEDRVKPASTTQPATPAAAPTEGQTKL
ncbi:MAG: hypothetical protein ACRDJ5_12210 [Actinomycetota bacterium]